MTQTATPTVSYEVYLAERKKRIEAERERDALKKELFLLRDIRRAPVLKPVAKEVLNEIIHTERWGKVHDASGRTRANFKTIADRLHISPDTVARQAERLQKLGLVDVNEHQGPEDEYERKYVLVKEEHLRTIGELTDPDKIVPQQGGNRYICLNPECNSTDVRVRTVTRRTITVHCNQCHHEHVKEEEPEDSGWKQQNGHKAQKQLAFEPSPTNEHAEHAEATCFSESDASDQDEKQLAEHCMRTHLSQPQTAFEELKALKIWCPHRAKVPYQLRGRDPQKAKPNDPATWSTYEDALKVYQDSQHWKYPYHGIGCMNPGGYVFIDLDKCRDPETGKVSAEACAFILQFQTYWETSQSGTGLHAIARGSLPAGMKESGMIELYPDNRFFVWTGNHLDGTTDTIEDCHQEANALYTELRPAREEPAAQPTIDETTLDDQALQRILAKVRNGQNGAKWVALYDSGNWREAGYQSQSEADAALCNELAYRSDNNVSAIDALFRKSALIRAKWDRSVGSGETYGERTIRRALVRRKGRAA